MESDEKVCTEITASEEASLRDLEFQARVKYREKGFRDVLSPLEGYILQLQSLLVWEKPRRSALMFIIVNVIFWLVSTTQYRIVFLCSVSAICYICVETIHTKIWPEIKVKPAEPEDEEGWTPVHPDLLSLPELCQYLGTIWVKTEDFWATVLKLRNQQPAKFCLYVCSTCLLLAAIGHQIRGLFLTYILLMGVLLWPCLEYYQVTKQLYKKLEPLLKQFEHSVEQTTYQSRRARALSRRTNQAHRAARRELLGESDSELEDFCPTPNPACDAALAQAATMSSCNTPSLGSLRTTPIMMMPSSGVIPRGWSIDEDGQTTDTEGASFMGGLSSMPAYDDGILDHSADELDIELPRDSRSPSAQETPPPKLTALPPDDIQFVSTHFHASSSEDDDELGLPSNQRIPNYDTFDRRDRRSESVDPSMVLPPAAQQLLTNTVASVMQDAMSTMAGQMTPSGLDTTDPLVNRPVSTKQQSTEINISQQPGAPQLSDAKEKPRLVASDSSELADQFEMLDQSELSSLDPSVSPTPEQPAAAGESSMARLSDYGMGIINSWWGGKK